MRTLLITIVAAPVALLGGCGSSTTNTTTTNVTTVETTNTSMVADDTMTATTAVDNAVTANATAAAPAAASLSAYAGKTPFEKVAGKTFVETDAVKAAIAGTGADAKVRTWLANTMGPASPIVMKDGKLLMNECQEHNCGDHNWTIAIAPDGSAPEICYYDAAASKNPQWFVNGKAVDRPATDGESCIQPGM
jgi:uncharacterized protein YceK